MSSLNEDLKKELKKMSFGIKDKEVEVYRKGVKIILLSDALELIDGIIGNH